jgi:hydroxymethylbilane synthase
MGRLRIGTRGSALARAQAGAVADALQAEIVIIAVSGDAPGTTAEPAPAGTAPSDKSRWVDRIEAALLDGSIDLAVHSAKDVPGRLAAGTVLAGAPAREDARDALCGAERLEQLGAGARVGTGSIRRAAQLRAARDDLDVVALRGNVDTRLRRLADGDYDAIVLACAGLRRLGRGAAAGGALPAERFVPAPGQGLLALQARAGDETVLRAAAGITDDAATAALAAERALAAGLDASCHTPLGAHARPADGGGLELLAFVGLPDGSAWLRDALTGDAREPEALGRTVAERLRGAGADALLARAEELAGAGA